VYDSLLYLCTLLGNIAESLPDCKHILARLPLIAYQRNGTEAKPLSLVEFIAQVVQMEAASFLHDLRETDDAVRQSTATVSEVTPDSKSGVDTVDPIPASPIITTNLLPSSVTDSSSNTAGVSKNSEQLPVSEIILASHASLVLFSLTHDWRIVEESEEATTESWTTLKQMATVGLPDASWWLPLRVLKASLFLQSQVTLYSYFS